MESAAVLRSFQCSVSTVAHVQSVIEKSGVVSMSYPTLRKSSITQGLPGCGRLFSSPVIRKTVSLPCMKASETTLAATGEVASLDGNAQGQLEKENTLAAVFPNGFEELLLEVCDETDIAELKLKIGDFEMNLRRNIEATNTPPPLVSHSAPTAAVPSTPVVNSAPASSTSSSSSPEKVSPFINVSSEKSMKLAALEASGSTGYVVVPSTMVGVFLAGKTGKEGKRSPPVCKVGSVIKEGQIIGFLEQFGMENPLRSNVAGEVVKVLCNDGEPIGYGDPLIAVLPSFHGIQ